MEESVGLEPKSRRTAPASNRAVAPATFTLRCGQPGTRTLRGWFWRPASALRAAHGGPGRTRTGCFRRARTALSQVSYRPRVMSAWRESNPRPPGPRPGALPPAPHAARVTGGNRTHDRRATTFRLATWLRPQSTCRESNSRRPLIGRLHCHYATRGNAGSGGANRTPVDGVKARRPATGRHRITCAPPRSRTGPSAASARRSSHESLRGKCGTGMSRRLSYCSVVTEPCCAYSGLPGNRTPPARVRAGCASFNTCNPLCRPRDLNPQPAAQKAAPLPLS